MASAKLGARVPLLFEYVADCRPRLTHTCELAAVLTPGNALEWLAAVEHESKHAERQMVQARRHPAPESAPAAVPLAPAQAKSHVESLPAPAPSAPASSHAPAHGTPAKRGRVVPNLTGGADVVREGDPAVVVARALETLGFGHREARHAAGLSEGQPGISVEPRVKLALRQLSSAVIARSERWARATS